MKTQLTWEFYSARRKVTLEKFLEGVKSYNDAIKYFDSLGVKPPFNLHETFSQKSSKMPNEKDYQFYDDEEIIVNESEKEEDKLYETVDVEELPSLMSRKDMSVGLSHKKNNKKK